MVITRIGNAKKGSYLIMLEDVGSAFRLLLTPKKNHYKITLAYVNSANEGNLISSTLTLEWLRLLDETYNSNYYKLTSKYVEERHEIFFKRSTKEFIDEFISRISIILNSLLED